MKQVKQPAGTGPFGELAAPGRGCPHPILQFGYAELQDRVPAPHPAARSSPFHEGPSAKASSRTRQTAAIGGACRISGERPASRVNLARSPAGGKSWWMPRAAFAPDA